MIAMQPWKRGFFVHPSEDEDLRMYFWFYEWHLFEAIQRGQHTQGNMYPDACMDGDANACTLSHPDCGLELTARAVGDGVELSLQVTNRSDHDWPALASIVPCFNPGGEDALDGAVPSERFYDEEHERTWFLGTNGFDLLLQREIHFNQQHRAELDAQSNNGEFEFSYKWPTSPLDAGGGLLVRESTDRTWVAGIAWEDYLSLQGHNPWRCMHQSIRLGPLAPGASREIGGKIYLFEGTKEDCLERFRQGLRQGLRRG